MIAFGGNALSPRGEAGTITQQFAKTRESLAPIMHFVEHGYKLCITHGNGPQVGDELLRMDLTHDTIPPLPLGVCVAGTQGTIGYMIQQSLQNILYQKIRPPGPKFCAGTLRNYRKGSHRVAAAPP